jgi:hypothetical protein
VASQGSVADEAANAITEQFKLGPVTAKLCKMAIQERGRPQISKEWAT